MFFWRPAPKLTSWQERLGSLGDAGFAVRELGQLQVEVSRDRCAAIVRDVPGGLPQIERSGIQDGSEILRLVDGGFMKLFESPESAPRPALAADLKRLHDFHEDLDEALGIGTLYNESLGTVCDRHTYDRLSGR
jgi:hypothetical protein